MISERCAIKGRCSVCFNKTIIGDNHYRIKHTLKTKPFIKIGDV